MNEPLKVPKPYVPEQVRVSGIRFLCEQAGPFEDQVKAKFSDFFERDKSVERAYLVRIQNGEAVSVALCIKSGFGKDSGMAEKIGRIFATIFRKDQSMDILFLTDEREAELCAVCLPFYDSNEPTSQPKQG